MNALAGLISLPSSQGTALCGATGPYGQRGALLPLDTGLVLGAPRRLGTVNSLILILGFLLTRLENLDERKRERYWLVEGEIFFLHNGTNKR